MILINLLFITFFHVCCTYLLMLLKLYYYIFHENVKRSSSCFVIHMVIMSTYQLKLQSDVFQFLILKRQRLQLQLISKWTCRRLRRESGRSASSFSGTHHAGVCGPPTWSPYLPPRRLCSLSTVIAIEIFDFDCCDNVELESKRLFSLLFIFCLFVTNTHYL